MQSKPSANRQDIYISGELLKLYLLEYTKVPVPPKGYSRQSRYVSGLLRLGLAHIGECYKDVPTLMTDNKRERLITYLSDKAKADIGKCIEKYGDRNSEIVKIILYIGLKKKREQDEQRLAKIGFAKGL